MNDFIKILVVEDNDMSREMMVNVLLTRGYTVFQAKDGEAALEIIPKNDIHVALVDINMSPMDGLEFIRTLLINRIKIPTIVVTADPSSDLLAQAVELGVAKVLQKPVLPDRLLKSVERVVERQGLSANPAFVEKRQTTYSHKELMQRAIDLAANNAISGRGRPFGAVVADKDGHILGVGTNGLSSRVDPTAHAEVLAIRQAAEKLGTDDLSECVLYCSSEPTLVGQSLVLSVGIQDVYFGLTHKEVAALREGDTKARDPKAKIKYRQLCHEEAAEMLKSAQKSGVF